MTCGARADADRAEDGDDQKPQQHHRPERAADGSGTIALHHKQQQQDHGGSRHRVAGEILACELQPFDRAQHRDGRRDHAVAVEQRRADQAEGDKITVAPMPFCPGQRHQRQNAALAVIVGAHDHQRVFQRNDDDQRPENQRQAAERAEFVVMTLICFGDGLKNVERTGADIAIDDAERRDQRKGFEPVGALGPALLWVT